MKAKLIVGAVVGAVAGWLCWTEPAGPERLENVALYSAGGFAVWWFGSAKAAKFLQNINTTVNVEGDATINQKVGNVARDVNTNVTENNH